jgi:hypothetical protein
MGLQRYRADKQGAKQANGGTPWYSEWMGGPTLALIRNCFISNAPLDLTSELSNPRTVYVRGVADTFFTIPAACRYSCIKGRERILKGYITIDENGEYYFVAEKE